MFLVIYWNGYNIKFVKFRLNIYVIFGRQKLDLVGSQSDVAVVRLRGLAQLTLATVYSRYGIWDHDNIRQ